MLKLKIVSRSLVPKAYSVRPLTFATFEFIYVLSLSFPLLSLPGQCFLEMFCNVVCLARSL